MSPFSTEPIVVKDPYKLYYQRADDSLTVSFDNDDQRMKIGVLETNQVVIKESFDVEKTGSLSFYAKSTTRAVEGVFEALGTKEHQNGEDDPGVDIFLYKMTLRYSPGPTAATYTGFTYSSATKVSTPRH